MRRCAVALLFLTSCSTYYCHFRIQTDPPGGHVYGPQGQYWGQAPVVQSFENDDQRCWSHPVVVQVKKPGYLDAQQAFLPCPSFEDFQTSRRRAEAVQVVLQPTNAAPR